MYRCVEKYLPLQQIIILSIIISLFKFHYALQVSSNSLLTLFIFLYHGDDLSVQTLVKVVRCKHFDIV